MVVGFRVDEKDKVDGGWGFVNNGVASDSHWMIFTKQTKRDSDSETESEAEREREKAGKITHTQSESF